VPYIKYVNDDINREIIYVIARASALNRMPNFSQRGRTVRNPMNLGIIIGGAAITATKFDQTSIIPFIIGGICAGLFKIASFIARDVP